MRMEAKALKLLRQSRARLAAMGCSDADADRIAFAVVRTFRVRNMKRRIRRTAALTDTAVAKACARIALSERSPLTPRRQRGAIPE